MTISPVEPRRALLWPDIVGELAEHAPDPASLYMVGGMVRDALLGRPLHDVDLATPGDGLAKARALADALGGAYYPVDPERRTGRVILSGESTLVIDVASFRGDDLLADLQGRDFTVNAMAVRLDQPQMLYDPLGGQRDLFDDRVLRQCSPTSISSDPIRALRAVRQTKQFRLRMAPETVAAARAASSALYDGEGRLEQPERARDELFRVLGGPEPAAALRVLQVLGLLAPLTPYPLVEESLQDRLRLTGHLHDLLTIISPARTDNTASQLKLGVAVMILDRYRADLQDYLSQVIVEGRPLGTLMLLTALTPPELSEPGRRWAAHLHLARGEADFITKLAASQAAIPTTPLVDARAAHRYYRAFGEMGIAGVLLMLARALHAPTTSPEQWGILLEHVAAPLLEAYFRRHDEIVDPEPLIDGRALMRSFDLQPGPHIGRILEQTLEEQAAGTLHTTQEALHFAERLIKELS